MTNYIQRTEQFSNKQKKKGKRTKNANQEEKDSPYPLSLSRRRVKEHPAEHLSWCVGFLRFLASLVDRLVAWVS